jgi:hypothetical protein
VRTEKAAADAAEKKLLETKRELELSKKAAESLSKDYAAKAKEVADLKTSQGHVKGSADTDRVSFHLSASSLAYPLCQCAFNVMMRKPYLLLCGHHICGECLQMNVICAHGCASTAVSLPGKKMTGILDGILLEVIEAQQMQGPVVDREEILNNVRRMASRPPISDIVRICSQDLS